MERLKHLQDIAHRLYDHGRRRRVGRPHAVVAVVGAVHDLAALEQIGDDVRACRRLVVGAGGCVDHAHQFLQQFVALAVLPHDAEHGGHAAVRLEDQRAVALMAGPCQQAAIGIGDAVQVKEAFVGKAAPLQGALRQVRRGVDQGGECVQRGVEELNRLAEAISAQQFFAGVNRIAGVGELRRRARVAIVKGRLGGVVVGAVEEHKRIGNAQMPATALQRAHAVVRFLTHKLVTEVEPLVGAFNQKFALQQNLEPVDGVLCGSGFEQFAAIVARDDGAQLQNPKRLVGQPFNALLNQLLNALVGARREQAAQVTAPPARLLGALLGGNSVHCGLAQRGVALLQVAHRLSHKQWVALRKLIEQTRQLTAEEILAP